MALTDNLVSYWKLDEASGNAADSVGSNTLTPQASATRAAGIISNGASLPGASDYFSKSSPSGLTPTGDFTYSFWLKGTSFPGSDAQWMILWANSGGNDGFYLPIYHPSPGNLGLRMKFYQSGSGSTGGNFEYAFSTGVWYHIVCTFKSSTKALKFYVNGSLLGTQTDTLSGMSANNTEFRIGSSGSSQPGVIDEVGVWSRELSSTEVSQLYNSGAGLQYPFVLPQRNAGLLAVLAGA